jgi:hypothetical protein
MPMLGPYRLDALLGRGGMGEVYRAYDTEHDRRVALKILPAALSRDPKYRSRFRREAKLASGLTDPHVVPIHRYGEIDGQLFLDMRLVEGEDLEAVLRRERRLAPDAAVRLVEQVASALDDAHREGLVHRDVKPSNVFLTRPGSPDAPRFAYLGDFGIARTIAGTSSAVLTATGTAVGTPDYMAPERFSGDAVDGRADVYSLACLLHECLTGERPFVRDGLAALMHAHMFSPPPRPSACKGVPAGFDAVVARGVAKDPAQRTPTAGEVAAQARAVLAGPAPTAFTDPATNRLAVVPASGAPGTAPPVVPQARGAHAGFPAAPPVTPSPGAPPPAPVAGGTPSPHAGPPWQAVPPPRPGEPAGSAYPAPDRNDAAPAPMALVACLLATLGLVVPQPGLNVVGFCVLVPVLGAATLRNRRPLAAPPPKRIPAAALLLGAAVAVAGLLAAAVPDTAARQGILVVLTLAMVGGWAVTRRRR